MFIAYLFFLITSMKCYPCPGEVTNEPVPVPETQGAELSKRELVEGLAQISFSPRQSHGEPGGDES